MWPDPWPSLGGAAVVVAVAALALNAYSDQPAVGGPPPSDDPQSPFLGTWFSTSDPDGGTQTMTVRATQAGGVEIVVTDTIATVCSSTPSTMTGTGTPSRATPSSSSRRPSTRATTGASRRP